MSSSLCVHLMSASTFARGEPTAADVDTEVEHDDLGLPFLGGKALHGLLRDSWLSMAPAFGHLSAAAARVLGTPGASGDAALRIGDAEVDAATRTALRWAVDNGEMFPHDILHAVTDIRTQTAEDRVTGAPLAGSLRRSRVVLRDLDLIAPLTWTDDAPQPAEEQVLALAALGTRHAGLGRSRGRGHIRILIDNDGEATRRLVRDAAAASKVV